MRLCDALLGGGATITHFLSDWRERVLIRIKTLKIAAHSRLRPYIRTGLPNLLDALGH